MRIRTSFTTNMFNWAITPSICVWHNDNSGIAIHFLRARFAIYTDISR